eukprot:CAMPEP_0184493058 /NCGR_PEP_ID=MMETSP0113_2-20130426/24994_1 /TAXON_ID=91329 /ORGANISM="Norrisiella sphaerica, Strain BC52" /LENGTH=179 /DNA_ID=CAMNT_0026878177 /DNA_START=1 /DNA_END=540 /DNA_ORIENTATION=-
MTAVSHVVVMCLLGLAFIFSCVGLAGAEGAVGWSVAEVGDCDVRYGNLRVKVSGCSAASSQRYTSCDDTSDVCDKCVESGEAALTFVAFAFLCLLGAMFLVFLQLIGKFDASSWIVVAVLALSTFCFVLAWASWFGCHNEAKDANDDVELGPAWILTFIASLLTATATVIEAAISVKGS